MFALLAGSFESSRDTRFEVFIVQDLILGPTVWLINVLDPTQRVELVGRTFVSATAQLHVTRGCEGVEMFFLLIAAIVAFPASLERKALGLCTGLVLAYALSVARLVALDYTLRHAPNTWEALHGLVLPLAPVIALAWFFLHWSSAGTSRVPAE